MGRNYSNKNLTELEIGNIEFYLNEKKSPAEIAKILSKDPSGIRKEKKVFFILWQTKKMFKLS